MAWTTKPLVREGKALSGPTIKKNTVKRSRRTRRTTRLPKPGLQKTTQEATTTTTTTLPSSKGSRKKILFLMTVPLGVGGGVTALP